MALDSASLSFYEHFGERQPARGAAGAALGGELLPAFDGAPRHAEQRAEGVSR